MSIPYQEVSKLPWKHQPQMDAVNSFYQRWSDQNEMVITLSEQFMVDSIHALLEIDIVSGKILAFKIKIN